MSDVSGHVFIVRGDLLRFACDAIVIPTDRSGRIEQPWLEHLAGLGVHVAPAPGDPKGGGWLYDADRERIGGPVGPEERLPRTWLLATATTAGDSREHVDGETGQDHLRSLEDTLEAFAHRFARSKQGGAHLGGRACPLVAIPLLGSGEGGFRERFRHFARELLSILQRAASAGEFDIALVVFGDDRVDVYDALLRRERRQLPWMTTAPELAERWELGPSVPTSPTSVRDVIERLLGRAVDGQLVPFFGAGVSVAAGAHSWSGLLDALDTEAREQAAERGETLPDVRELDAYDRAQIYHRLLGPEAFDEEIRKALSIDSPSLQHHLLAALRSRDAVTTNFDTAYELAVTRANLGEVAVIPASAGELRLLKLHGSLPSSPDPDGAPPASPPLLPPVFTRDQLLEHRAYGDPLRGSLQMMLLTGHVAFVGYSLSDSHLHEAIHQVRRIRAQAGGPGRSTPALATTIQVEAAPHLSLTWAPDVDVIWPRAVGSDGAASGGIAARELELLLDALADAASLAEIPVLAFEDDELDEHEVEIKRSLKALAAALPGSGHRPAAVQSLLRAFGG